MKCRACNVNGGREGGNEQVHFSLHLFRTCCAVLLASLLPLTRVGGRRDGLGGRRGDATRMTAAMITISWEPFESVGRWIPDALPLRPPFSLPSPLTPFYVPLTDAIFEETRRGAREEWARARRTDFMPGTSQTGIFFGVHNVVC